MKTKRNSRAVHPSSSVLNAPRPHALGHGRRRDIRYGGKVGSCGPASNRFRIRGFCRRQVPRQSRNRTTPAPVRQGPRRAANGTPQRIRERVLFHILFPALPPLPQYPVPPLQEQRRHLQRCGLKNVFPRQGTPFGIVITPRPCPACSRRYPPSPAAAARHAGHHRLQTGVRTGLYSFRHPTASASGTDQRQHHDQPASPTVFIPLPLRATYPSRRHPKGKTYPTGRPHHAYGCTAPTAGQSALMPKAHGLAGVPAFPCPVLAISTSRWPHGYAPCPVRG